MLRAAATGGVLLALLGAGALTRPARRAAAAPPASAAASTPDGGAADAGRPRNDAGEEIPETIRIKVGGHHELRLGFVCIEAICDDKTVVRVEDGGDHLRLVGLAVGATLCGFWKERSPWPHRLFRIEVVPNKPPKPKDGGVRG